MTSGPPAPDAAGASTRRHVRVLVIGSGFAGLGAAIRLSQAGYDDYLVVERGSEVGGTWRDNTYPGAACDVPSQLYSYSFELNPHWSRSFSPQPEILQYLRDTARKYGTLDRHLFDTEVLLARWDEDGTRWLVDTTRGAFSADVLVPAVGALCEPRLPDIPGIERFRGQIFHSARWDHGADLAGRRVALIGTGASAIQIAPELAGTASRLHVFQRTAPWVLPRRDRAYSRLQSLAFARVPGAQRLVRESIYWGRELFVLGFAYQPRILTAARALATRHIARAIGDPALRRAVTPAWQIGCKRILLSDTWYPTLARPDVELVTERISEITADSVVTADGTARRVDAVVVATGFRVTDSPAFERIVGADGRSLAEVWGETGQQAYKGAAVQGFPNLLFLIGPNTGLGHTSMVFMAESQVNYLVDALRVLDARGVARFEVRPDAQRRYNERLQRRMRPTVWSTGGCSSWYLDAHGNNTTLWPGFTFTFRAMTRRFDLAAYRTAARRGDGAADRDSSSGDGVPAGAGQDDRPRGTGRRPQRATRETVA